MLSLSPLLLSLISLTTAQTITDSTTSFQTDSSSDPARNSLSASFMNITFSPSTHQTCSDLPSNSTTSSELSIAIRTLPQTQACFNFADTFSDPATTYNSEGTGRCDSKLGLCGIKYTVFNSLDENTINQQAWSNVFYTQVRNPLDEGGEEDGEGEGGRLELTVYNKDGCESQGDAGSARWNCVSAEGSCNSVGFAVKSFKVALMDAQDVGTGSCVVAATSGVESVRGRVGMIGMVLGVFVTTLGWM